MATTEYREIDTKALDNLIKSNYEATEACNKALRMMNRLIGKIEDMKCDCDGEVYDDLLKIQYVLVR